MKKTLNYLLVTLAILTLTSCSKHTQEIAMAQNTNVASVGPSNPIIQTTFTADPAPMVYNDTVFLYTSHDVTTSYDFNMQDWHLFSTIDMVNWTDRGAPLSLKTFSWANADAWAGQCIFRNGKFYWYVPMSRADGKGMAIGVAVGPTAEGPFIDAIGAPLAYTGLGDIDPTVFIDTDGQAYLYWGNPHLFYVKLNQDMISYSGEIQTVPLTEQGFGKRTGDPNRFT
jgi:arabinoxylan arabinofuranohydrolase